MQLEPHQQLCCRLRVLEIRKWPHRKKIPKGIAATDLVVAPMDLVARALNAHTGPWADFESFKGYDLVLVGFC
jgi:hypothetical protein